MMLVAMVTSWWNPDDAVVSDRTVKGADVVDGAIVVTVWVGRTLGYTDEL
jgi:hypothetical protein